MRNNFVLYSNCITVKGANRSIIADLQKNHFVYINNDLYDVINKLTFNDVDSIYLEYGIQNKETLDEYFEFISDFGFYCTLEEKKRFPKIDLTYEVPCEISNAIIENSLDIKSVVSICNQLMLLRCSTLELIYYEEVSNEFILDLLLELNKSFLKQINLTLKFDESKTINAIEELCSSNHRINKMILHNSKEDNFIKLKNIFNIYFLKKDVKNFLSCGQINESHFTINLLHFSESLSHNSCLNKKISIDKDGNIKNCPAMPESFGNIKDTTLVEALNHSDFKKYWNITKDQIDVCRDCEFRYICTDCRAYVENPEDQYSKPLKCGYDPYTNEWAEWSKNPLKQNAIEYYGMQELVKRDL